MATRRILGGDVMDLLALYGEVELRPKHVVQGLMLGLCCALDSWECIVVGFLLPGIMKDFHLSTVGGGVMASSLYIGMLLGSYLWGPLGEKWGRRTLVDGGLLGYGVFTILSACTYHYGLFLALRFMAGLMLSATDVAIFPYCEELLPAKYRGLLVTLLGAGFPFGTLAAALLCQNVIPSLGWRTALFISGTASAWGLVCWYFIPESPLWLAATGRYAKARKVLASLFPEAKEEAKADSVITFPKRTETGTYRDLFKPEFRKLTWQLFVLNFAFAWAYWGLFVWLPTVLINERGLSYFASANFVIYAALAQLIGRVIAAWSTKRFGRKNTAIPFLMASAILGVVFATTHSLGMALITFALMSLCSDAAWGVWDTWMSEIYPTTLRNVSGGWGVGMQKFSNTVAPIVSGYLISWGGGLGTLVGIAVVFLAITAWIMSQFRETEGVSLD